MKINEVIARIKEVLDEKTLLGKKLFKSREK